MFGKNIVISQYIEPSGSLKIVDLFYTIQGEGPYNGMPSVFVRLAGCNLRCEWCFIPSTLITMGNFTKKRIDQIAVGDEILSWSGTEFVKKRVLKTMQSVADTIVKVDAGGSPVWCTPEHPFLVSGKGWVEAAKLLPGDILVHLSASNVARMNNPRTRDGGLTKLRERVGQYISNGKVVKSVTVVQDKALARIYGKAGAEKQVYNFEVEDTHTYIANGMVVHNCDTDFETGAVVRDLAHLLELIQVAANHRTKLVVITGGEPLLQNIVPLIKELTRRQYRVQIETAGTVWIPLLEECDITLVCSPKTGKVNKEILNRCKHFKYVVGMGDTVTEEGHIVTATQPGAKPMALARPKDGTTIWIQPRDDHNLERNAENLKFAADLCLAHGYRMGVQLHKLIGVE